MESNVYKTDFSYFVRMALQDNMAWKSLAMILKDLAPTLHETREVISILLKEIEALQLALKEKDNELEMYQNLGASVDSQILTFKDKTIHGNVQQNSTSEKETIEDEIEVLEVVKERNDEDALVPEKEFYLDSKIRSLDESSDGKNMTGDDTSGTDMSMKEIDNEYYTFVANDKKSDSTERTEDSCL